MDIEFVRSRFIKHFDGKTGKIYHSPDVSTSLVSTPTTMEALYSQEQ